MRSMVGLLRRPNWKLECSLMAGKPVHSSGASTLVSSSSTTGRRDTWIQFSHCRFQRKVIVHPDGWFEEGGLGGISIRREDWDKSTTGDRQQARVRTLLRCCTCWQPGVAHLQFCITERSHFDIGKSLWPEPGSKETQPLQLRLLSSLGESLLCRRQMLPTR